jgi:hypothetical protein
MGEQRRESTANGDVYYGTIINIFTKQLSLLREAHYYGKALKSCDFYIFICS